MRLSQIALSVTDLRRSQGWYREVLGLEPAGGTNLFFGPIASGVQGIPRSASTCWWLVDRQDHFQIELFEFRSPPVRRMPLDRRRSDLGYTAITFSVDDLDATLERARAAGTPAPGDPAGSTGERRACVRDPDGVFVELIEEDPRAAAPRERPRERIGAVARAVTLSVPDLERSASILSEALGLAVAEGLELHRPEHEALWGMEGAQSESRSFWADDFLVELVHYREPAGRPPPRGYRISDQGLLNVAFGFRQRDEFEAAYRRCREAGLEPNGPPVRFGAWSVVYVNDELGTSFELLHAEPWFEAQMGFKPRRTPKLAPFLGRTPARIRQDRRFGRALVTGAAGGLGSDLCRLLAEDGTALALVDRDADGLQRLAAELSDRVEVRTIPVDFTDLEAVDAMAAGVADEHEDLDLVIASAGLDRAQSLLAFDWRQARDDFSVNALANLALLGRLLPPMAERGRGHVTALVSLAGLVGMPYEAPYSGSKAALAAIVESARAELAPRGLTFTAVFPGFVDTPMFRQNAFKHTYSIDARDAAERIYMATLRRRETLSFPITERARIGLAKLLPARIRDRSTRAAMNAPVDVGSPPEGQ
jgi:short-subunit dehydrogenase/catechol 2,3-dioxygenase-like lactoylglutathione lyase family enzyme